MGKTAEDIWFAGIATALKLAVSWFLLSIALHAWDKDKLDRTGARWFTNSRVLWSGEAATRSEGRLPVTLILVIETHPDYTYAIAHKARIHHLEVRRTTYTESGFWKIEGGRFQTYPKVCQGMEVIEKYGRGRFPCESGDSWRTVLTEDEIWEVEEAFYGTKHTFPMKMVD